ncbi:MAG: UPF0149 family protein [Burkholderiales bacterium]|nr:UPF0149 family protein [Burkholderiales bacterium]
MKPGLDTPLSEEELEALDRILLASDLDAPMDISMLDGYLCAVLSGPRPLPPSTWMPWVWDHASATQTPHFQSPKAEKQAAALVLRLANEIALGLTHDPDSFEPLFAERPADGGSEIVIDDWCFGFLKGMALDPAGWQPLRTARPDLFETIELYGTEAGWDKLEQEIERLPDADARHAGAVAAIAPALRAIHAHWRERGAAEPAVMAAGEPRRAGERPGRNAPCPCGSGRKYKQCHGKAA